jgi:hypothetical protein
VRFTHHVFISEEGTAIEFMRSSLRLVVITLILLAPLSVPAAAAHNVESYTYRLTQSPVANRFQTTLPGEHVFKDSPCRHRLDQRCLMSICR